MTHQADRWGTVCVEDGEPWPCPAVQSVVDVAGMTWHVSPAAGTRDPHHAEPNYCPVCERELPAGHMRHAACDPRWLQAPSSTTEGRQ